MWNNLCVFNVVTDALCWICRIVCYTFTKFTFILSLFEYDSISNVHNICPHFSFENDVYRSSKSSAIFFNVTLNFENLFDVVQSLFYREQYQKETHVSIHSLRMDSAMVSWFSNAPNVVVLSQKEHIIVPCVRGIS